MKKTTLLLLFVAIIFSSCSSKNSLSSKLQDIIQKHYEKQEKKNEVIISYDEYQKIYNNIDKSIQNDNISDEIVLKNEIRKSSNKKILEDLTNLNKSGINNSLMAFYDEWKGVKYKFGGNSKKGIDCSAFTQRVFKEKFNIKIPRTTRTQVHSGKKVSKSNLKIGDLVFFKTGKIDRHVGVYMGNGKFLHASIKGVKFSSLNKPFYKKAYWTSRRLIN